MGIVLIVKFYVLDFFRTQYISIRDLVIILNHHLMLVIVTVHILQQLSVAIRHLILVHFALKIFKERILTHLLTRYKMKSIASVHISAFVPVSL